MKLKFILAIALFTISFSSCKKCVTCVPYLNDGYYGTGHDTIAPAAQSVVSCNKLDITAYENGTHFTNYVGTPITFQCK
jgi:hypothetical protein